VTKKHFIALADFIKNTPELKSPEIVNTLARFCVSQNGQFKTQRFVNYIAGKCGKNGGSVKSQP